MTTKLFIKLVLIFSILFAGISVQSSHQVEAASIANDFTDVSKKNSYYEYIKVLVNSRIISGYPDGTFRPNETISRKQAAALVNRATNVKTTISYLHMLAQPDQLTIPKDVSLQNPNYRDITAMLEAGIMKLDSKGNFYPNKPVTRGEMARILVNAFDLTTNQLKTRPFSDVSSTVRPFAEVLYANNIASGYEDKTFREKENLSRAHFSVFMYRVIHIEDFWSKEQAELSKKLNYERRLQAEDRLVDSDEKKKLRQIGKRFVLYYMKPDSIQRPVGFSTKEQHNEWLKIRVKEKHSGVSKWFLHVNYTEQYLGETIVSKAEWAHKTPEEILDILNHAILSGEVYNEGYFSLYYNHEEKILYQSVGKGWGPPSKEEK